MPKNQAEPKELAEEMAKRSSRVLKEFRQISTSGVKNSELLSILEDVKQYWIDNFRPSLASFSCEAVGGEPQAADKISLMISLMGAGLGIHDDIIDKSSSKHFRRTILGLHGNDNALLIGELFIVKSLAMIPVLIKDSFSPQQIKLIVKDFEKFFIEVWEGEFLETRCRRNIETDLEDYQKIQWMSTADTEACARLGAFVGGGTKKEVEALAEFGRRLGLLYRFADDVKDTLNFEGNLSNRLENESVPLPILFAAKSSNGSHAKIKHILEKEKISVMDEEAILKICSKSHAFDYVQNLSKLNEQEALRNIESLKNSKAKNNLTLMLSSAFAYVNNLCSST